MRVLFVGGTKFIGLAAVKQLHEAGHEVTVFHRGRTDAGLPTGSRRILGDRAQLAEHRAAFAAARPDVVVDMVLMTEAEARVSVETFRGIAGRLVAISSQDVYRAWGRLLRTEPGPPDPVPLTEDAPLRERLYPYRGRGPGIPDDYDKIPAERTVLGEPALPGTVLRLPLVYGPNDAQRRTLPYLKRLDDGRPIPLGERFADWRWSHGYVENVAHAIALAVTDERAAGRVYNVAEPTAPTQREWVEAIARAAGRPADIVILRDDAVPAHIAWPGDTDQSIVADTTRLRAELGYVEPVDLDEALRRTVAWERANPPAQFDPATFDYAAEDAALGRIGNRRA